MDMTKSVVPDPSAFLEAPSHKTVLAVPKIPLEPVLATGPTSLQGVMEGAAYGQNNATKPRNALLA
jgi:hypothetical protein